ncbi:MAG: hypothetical protein ACJA1A_000818 [Saprospiraceae bacterium]|jgi:hypothetical protein
MRNIKLFCIVSSMLVTVGFISCETSEEKLCIAYFLEEFNMKPYNGEDLACKTYIRLYEYENTQFALMDNHCADFAPFTVYDCNGEEFCFTSIGPCYIQESLDLGIIGIEK